VRACVRGPCLRCGQNLISSVSRVPRAAYVDAGVDVDEGSSTFEVFTGVRCERDSTVVRVGFVASSRAFERCLTMFCHRLPWGCSSVSYSKNPRSTFPNRRGRPRRWRRSWSYNRLPCSNDSDARFSERRAWSCVRK